MRLLTSAILLASALFLGGCTMPGATDDATRLETGAGDRAAVATPDAAPAPATSPAPATPSAPPTIDIDAAPPMSQPLPPEQVPARAASASGALDRSCRTSADCTVKNVGNCCGAMPACVNTNARPDPAAVQAQCAKDGMSSVCGFKEVTGCSCVAGTCQDQAGAVTQ